MMSIDSFELWEIIAAHFPHPGFVDHRASESAKNAATLFVVEYFDDIPPKVIPLLGKRSVIILDGDNLIYHNWDLDEGAESVLLMGYKPHPDYDGPEFAEDLLFFSEDRLVNYYVLTPNTYLPLVNKFSNGTLCTYLLVDHIMRLDDYGKFPSIGQKAQSQLIEDAAHKLRSMGRRSQVIPFGFKGGYDYKQELEHVTNRAVGMATEFNNSGRDLEVINSRLNVFFSSALVRLDDKTSRFVPDDERIMSQVHRAKLVYYIETIQEIVNKQ